MNVRARALSLLVSAALVGLASVSFTARADDPPDSAVNPATGSIETVDSAWSGDHLEVRHVVKSGPGARTVTTLPSALRLDDREPRLAIGGPGNTYLVWWRDGATPEIVMRTRNQLLGSWGDERILSLPGEVSRRPRIVFDGTRPWIAYEVGIAPTTSVAIQPGGEDSDPIPARKLLATTTNTGDIDIDLQSAPGKLWVSWIDDAQHVGWSQYDRDTDTWTSPEYETAVDGVTAARDRIRARVLGG